MTQEDAIAIDNLILCGVRMSNFLHNLKQRFLGEPWDQNSKAMAAHLQQEWDAHKTASVAARQRMNDLPAAFDPIEMGA